MFSFHVEVMSTLCTIKKLDPLLFNHVLCENS